MPSDHRGGQVPPVVREEDHMIDAGDQALFLKTLHHLGNRWPAHLETVGNPRLDDVKIVLGELEDRLAVLLEGRMVFRRLVCHGPSLGKVVDTDRRPPSGGTLHPKPRSQTTRGSAA